MKEKKLFMSTEIRNLEKKYREEIKYIFKELSKGKNLDYTKVYSGDFHKELFNVFHVSDYAGYNWYVRTMESISDFDPDIAEDLEAYISKEIDLVALLCFRACIENLPQSD